MVAPGTPSLWVDLGSGPVQNPALTQDQFNTGLAAWQAANVTAFYANGAALVGAFLDPLAALIVASGVALGDANSLEVVKWIHSVYTFYSTNEATVAAWATPAAMDWTIMQYTSTATSAPAPGAPPVTLLTVATSVLAALNTKYPGKV